MYTKYLTNFWPIFPFYTPSKDHINFGFLVFFRVNKMRTLDKNGLTTFYGDLFVFRFYLFNLTMPGGNKRVTHT